MAINPPPDSDQLNEFLAAVEAAIARLMARFRFERYWVIGLGVGSLLLIFTNFILSLTSGKPVSSADMVTYFGSSGVFAAMSGIVFLQFNKTFSLVDKVITAFLPTSPSKGDKSE